MRGFCVVANHPDKIQLNRPALNEISPELHDVVQESRDPLDKVSNRSSPQCGHVILRLSKVQYPMMGHVTLGSNVMQVQWILFFLKCDT